MIGGQLIVIDPINHRHIDMLPGAEIKTRSHPASRCAEAASMDVKKAGTFQGDIDV